MSEEDDSTKIKKITTHIQDIQKIYLKFFNEENIVDYSNLNYTFFSNEKINDKVFHMIDIICLIIISLQDKKYSITSANISEKREVIDKYIKEIILKNILFNKKESQIDEEYDLVNIDLVDNQGKLDENEKRFLFFMNYNLISRNIISRIKPLFKLSEALIVLKIKGDLDDSNIIALYAYDNIFSIKILEEINALIDENAGYFSNSSDKRSDTRNYQQLKYIYGILNSSEQFNKYKNTKKGGGVGDKRPNSQHTDTEEPGVKRIKLGFNINDFIGSIITGRISSHSQICDLYDLDCGIYFTNDTYKKKYKISLHQFNMLISNDSEYIKNMFDILFIELKKDENKEIIKKIKNINDFAIFLFSKEFFIDKLNYMHGKQPLEQYSEIDEKTKVKISNGLSILKDTTTNDSTDTFENFKKSLLLYLEDDTTTDVSKISIQGDMKDRTDDSKIFTQGDIKHTIDTLIKIYYEAYLLGKQSKQCNKPQNGGKYYNYKNTGIKKIFNKKERCIYKMQGSNTEYIRHKNELISFKDFKTINNKPVKTEKISVNTEKKPVKTEKKPVKTEKKPVKTEKKPVKTEKKPVKTEKKPVKKDKKPLKTDEKPVKTDKKPVKTDKKPVKTYKKPVKTDKKPVKTDKKPVKTDKKPVKPVKKPVKKNIFFNLF
jgi:hypothetical protein